MPEDQSATFPLLPDGSRVVIPVARDRPASDLRVEVRGVVRCLYNNREYDALYEGNPGRPWDTARPHAYLNWQPYAPVVEEADVAAHRYVFRFASLAQGVSPTVRVDVDRFVNDFLIPPSEVRRSLSGGYGVTVRTAGIAPPVWPVALTAVPALALVGGLAWVLRRRMTNVPLEFDLFAQLARIHDKAAAARKAIQPHDARILPVRTRLKSLETGAMALATQIQQIRSARAYHNRAALERDIAALERRGVVNDEATITSSPGLVSSFGAAMGGSCLDGAGVPEELLLTLQQKRKSLQSLMELEKAERQREERLNRVEALLESTLAGLQSVRVGVMAAPVRESVCRALDAEVAALHDAARQPDDVIATGVRVGGR